MDCIRKIGSRCKDEKHFGEICGRLRPLICETRKTLDNGAKKKKRLILENPDYPEHLGIGA